MNNKTKEELNKILEEYGVRIRGKTYEYMIQRDNIIKYIDAISAIGLNVKCINWWCHCIDNDTSLGYPHGAGGPGFDGGHYGEIYRAYDETIKDNETAKTHILNKEISNRDGDTLTFSKNKCLTPSIFVE